MREADPVAGTDMTISKRGPISKRGQGQADPGQAAQGPIPAPVSAAANLLPTTPAPASAAAKGRRIVSTAFVMLGPDGLLRVELHNGRVLVLRDVTMGAADFCGVHVGGGSPGKRHCSGYADVAAAHPGATAAPPPGMRRR